jgi:hypothetical protein
MVMVNKGAGGKRKIRENLVEYAIEDGGMASGMF